MSSLPLALIIEDDEDLSFIFAEALRAANFEAEIIRDGRQAVERLVSVSPTVIVLDLHLPGVIGTEILNRIRSAAHLQAARVVVTTADARLAEQVEGQADFVLIKPISFSLLRDLAARLARS